VKKKFGDREELASNERVSKNAIPTPLASFPRRRESRFFKDFLDPRLRGGGDARDFFDTL
jgi:hypothetical protein